MKAYRLRGPCSMSGEVPISGAKNSALKLMAASLMIPGKVTLHRVPRIRDVHLMAEVLERLGAHVTFEGNDLTVDASGDLAEETPYELVTKMRASIQVLGPLLARLGRARVAMPGGDAIGSRPIDLHLLGLERMGAKFVTEHGYVEGSCGRLQGTSVLLEFPSVGATENLIMAGVLAEGTTKIENAAREPEIQDLVAFLQGCGAQISGAGTPSIEIEGVDLLGPTEHEIIPDRIEAGTYAIGVAAGRGDVTLVDMRPEHLELPLQKLEQAGAEVRRGDGEVRVAMGTRPHS
ncbi:MAG TPA: UDP-N-acetylglucosamine 1-carboxyvinyltransferase, partial [Actinomycetota bacterium]|nr:UDP-N-acetylglucosamine 1-carboxyvinyltransferase [Actinomycetota bacterium]